MKEVRMRKDFFGMVRMGKITKFVKEI